MEKKTGLNKIKSYGKRNEKKIYDTLLIISAIILIAIFIFFKPKTLNVVDKKEMWVITNLVDTTYVQGHFYKTEAYNLENPKNCVMLWDTIKLTYSKNDTIKLFSKK